MNQQRILRFLCLSLILFFLTGCGQEDTTPISKTGFYLDTVVQITIYDPQQEELIDQCFELAAQYEQLFSRTIEDSDVSRINAANGSPATVSQETLDLLTLGLSYCELSNGAFDITMGTISDLWDFTNNTGTLPDPELLSEALEQIGYQQIHISEDTVFLEGSEAQLDLGAIAKGYIADRMKEYLLSQGVQEGIINLGGNVLVLGPKTDASPYHIGIQRPFSQDGEPMVVVEITDGTVVTSGVYQRYFEKEGLIYHHILDSATGYPCENELLSVTILCPDSVDGDALSTCCFSLGLEQGMALVETLPDTEAIFITEDYQVHVSSGMGSNIPYTISENADNP